MNFRFLEVLVSSVALTVVAFAGQASDSSTTAGRFDGPAELPRVYVQSSISSTPAPGRVIDVRESDNLQKAVDAAKCGDTLRLEAGATFRGVFRLPAKSCDDSHWIILRTSATDPTLPPEGTRVSPCYAGVASLPGRPDFNCASVKNVLAKIEFDGNGDSGPLLFLPHANHYRLIGLEITRGKPQFHMRNLIQPKEPDDTADHLIFDRMWIHGTAQDETKGGIHLSGTTFVAVVDSYFTDFHCIARKGTCTDAQAINGGGGDSPGGPYKIVNNFLEASGQSIMFGGAPGTTTPADIEIRRNYLFKPLAWKPGEPDFIGSFTGDPYIVKNNFELKNAERVLFENNVLENCWGGFTQKGFSIVLTPANQGGGCPQCRITDVTIRYNEIRHVGGAINIGNVTGPHPPSAAGERYSIHDLLVDDIDGEKFAGTGSFAFIIAVAPPLKSVRMDHITAFPERAIFSILNQGPKIEDFSVSNSIFGAGERQIMGAGGGPANCAQLRDDPNSILKNCFSNATFSNNLILGGGGGWPRGNIFIKKASDAGVRDFRNGHNGDYRLCRGKEDGGSCQKSSPALAKGLDGKALGADIDGIEIEKAISGLN